ncbi:MAG: 2-C-methyl-D-erythritol 4-phosphate cytidylyltransferase [Roseibacillus sp.]|nr:2-C-methyl-D-erythritol 4-phosphate cytidylyltransferase [Roseibacillus sp.]MBP35710.1 2-C-methyl-D-erythritol 4-phosphate cytidylyltransferase [Roseibacillus sp.]MCP4728896.1 2-C-methyl-D-erythritol 4-phosphate cytidylyltransferase [Roseibacillus sp.]MDP7307455.1 2-C-methyl-D-erythritol 4-phosphate cytidylyltransferase [Roseibacillus sp.]HJM63188.1 2-C-methyl-D-erythritol 4-phosphate cytidylyltransferase [Roseibacillus sp.]
MSCAAIIVAAGHGRRMGFDKMVAPLGGKPVLQWSLDAFLEAGEVETVVVVTSEERFAHLDPGTGKPVLRVDGDRERFLSVMRGLDAIPSPPSYVAVHDGARPFILPEQIDQVIRTSHDEDAAALARRVTETIKTADDHDFTQRSVPRDRLWIMETPQAFRFEILRRAYRATESQALEVTDDVSAAEAIGVPTRLVENLLPNLKITLPQDLALAEAILKTRQE